MRGISTWMMWMLCLCHAVVHASPLPEDGSLKFGDLEAELDPKGFKELDVPGGVASGDRQKRKDSDGLSVVQTALLNFLRPMPIVDTITEEEKYGNDGDKFNRVGKTIVGGVEKVSEFVNRVTNIPVESVKKLSRSATEVLNNIGGRLVGLQR